MLIIKAYQIRLLIFKSLIWDGKSSEVIKNAVMSVKLKSTQSASRHSFDGIILFYSPCLTIQIATPSFSHKVNFCSLDPQVTGSKGTFLIVCYSTPYAKVHTGKFV